MHEKLSELLGVHIQSVVEFAKNLPHFSSLSQPDQLALLKGSFPEVWIVQSARFITFNDFKMTMYNGAAVKREELEFVYGVSRLLRINSNNKCFYLIALFKS